MGGEPRLFFVSPGNTDPGHRHRYPDANDSDGVRDPAQAQARNAVTVGEYTGRASFDQSLYPVYENVTPADDLSPCSTTLVSRGKHVNQAARDENKEFEAVGDTSGWELDPQLGSRGLVHFDCGPGRRRTWLTVDMYTPVEAIIRSVISTETIAEVEGDEGDEATN